MACVPLGNHCAKEPLNISNRWVYTGRQIPVLGPGSGYLKIRVLLRSHEAGEKTLSHLQVLYGPSRYKRSTVLVQQVKYLPKAPQARIIYALVGKPVTPRVKGGR